jgi:hypothetical protein
VECPRLAPTASREQVRDDEVSAAVAEAIEAQLLSGLEAIAREQPATWAEILRVHATLLKAWAALSPALLEAVAAHVRFDTTRGPRTLPALAEEGDGVVRCFTEAGSSRLAGLVADVSGRPVVDARTGGDMLFLEAWTSAHGVQLLVDNGLEGLQLTPVADPSPSQLRLAARFARPGLDVRLARIEPAALPAIRTGVDEDGGPIPLHGRAARRATATLHLNARSPLVAALAALPASPRLDAGVELVARLGELLGGGPRTPEAAREAVEDMAAAIEALVGAPLRDAAPRPLSPAWLARQGVARRAATALSARFSTLDELASASAAELAAAAGLPGPLVAAVQALAREELARPELDPEPPQERSDLQ